MFDDFSNDFWSEIQECEGEIFDLDIPELTEDETFNMNDYIEIDYDY
jgi:hypothetical protein